MLGKKKKLLRKGSHSAFQKDPRSHMPSAITLFPREKGKQKPLSAGVLP